MRASCGRIAGLTTDRTWYRITMVSGSGQLASKQTICFSRVSIRDVSTYLYATYLRVYSLSLRNYVSIFCVHTSLYATHMSTSTMETKHNASDRCRAICRGNLYTCAAITDTIIPFPIRQKITLILRRLALLRLGIDTRHFSVYVELQAVTWQPFLAGPETFSKLLW